MTKLKVFGHTYIKKYFFNSKEEIDKKMIEYFKDHLFMCVCANTIDLVLWPWKNTS